MKKMIDLTDVQIDILTACATATIDNPLTRSKLMQITHCADATSRRFIGELREMGYRICEGNGVNGYWLAKDEEEYQRFRANYTSRAKVIMKRARAMDKMLPGQMEMGY